MKVKSILTMLVLVALMGCQSFDDYVYETYDLELSNADNSGLTPLDVSGSAPILAYAIKMEFQVIVERNTVDEIKNVVFVGTYLQ